MKKRRITTIIEEIENDFDEGEIISKTIEIESIPFVNFRSCANYLIQLFYKTGKKYSCTNTKIGKLLSILAFKYACNGVILFSEPIYRYSNCGTYIRSTQYIQRDLYFRDLKDKNNDDKSFISLVNLDEKVNVPDYYTNINGLSSDMILDIENLFCEFGAYSQSDLSDLLNPIVEYDGVCMDNDVINLKAISLLDKSKFKGNKVVDYIFK